MLHSTWQLVQWRGSFVGVQVGEHFFILVEACADDGSDIGQLPARYRFLFRIRPQSFGEVGITHGVPYPTRVVLNPNQVNFPMHLISDIRAYRLQELNTIRKATQMLWLCAAAAGKQKRQQQTHRAAENGSNDEPDPRWEEEGH